MAGLCGRYIFGLLTAVLLVLIQAPTSEAAGAAFPLRYSADRRYLEDANGKPFLVNGDAAWSLIGDLSREDADKYLADRQNRGFNTILVSLIEHEFSRNAPRNFYKRAPFLPGGDFSQPNDAYFADADWILERANARGFLVLLAPAYMGANGGGQGWYGEMAAAGPAALKSYGRYLGERYRKFRNIVWVQGGDYDPPDRRLLNAVAEGIREKDPDAMQTMHAGRDAIVAPSWQSEEWFALDTVYTYGDVAAANLKRYLSGPAMPFIFVEGTYENELGSTEQSLRHNAYSAILAGACGQLFGNNPIWHFAGPTLYDVPVSWQESLNSRGSQSMSHFKHFFDALPWWKLEPELGRLVADADRSGFAIGALTKDRSTAVIYIADRRSVTVRRSALAKSVTQARWYDPSSGTFIDASDSVAGKPETITFETPAPRNSADFTDWILVLSSQG